MHLLGSKPASYLTAGVTLRSLLEGMSRYGGLGTGSHQLCLILPLTCPDLASLLTENWQLLCTMLVTRCGLLAAVPVAMQQPPVKAQCVGRVLSARCTASIKRREDCLSYAGFLANSLMHVHVQERPLIHLLHYLFRRQLRTQMYSGLLLYTVPVEGYPSL